MWLNKNMDTPTHISESHKQNLSVSPLTFFRVFFFFLDVDHFSSRYWRFVAILLLFYVLVCWLWGIWVISSPTKDWAHTPCIGRWNPTCWTAREVHSTTFNDDIWPVFSRMNHFSESDERFGPNQYSQAFYHQRRKESVGKEHLLGTQYGSSKYLLNWIINP